MTGRVDAGPVRAAAYAWWDEGWPAAAIAAAAGVTTRSVQRLLVGERPRVNREVAEAVLGVTSALLYTHARTYPAGPSRRRLQHLHLHGWSQTRISAGTGISGPGLSLITSGESRTVYKVNAHRIREFFLRHRNDDGGDERARHRALAHGWTPLNCLTDAQGGVAA